MLSIFHNSASIIALSVLIVVCQIGVLNASLNRLNILPEED